MARKYQVDLLELKDLENLEELFSKLEKVISSKEFMNFIADKCMLELNRISNERLDGIKDDDIFAEDVNRYRSNHKVDIGDDIIIISNDTQADLSHLSPKTLANYPDGFSISKAIEFGTGIWGESNQEFEWYTQAGERDYAEGWYYEKDGRLHWSKGLGGKFIYSELVEVISKKFEEWASEYLDRII